MVLMVGKLVMVVAKVDKLKTVVTTSSMLSLITSFEVMDACLVPEEWMRFECAIVSGLVGLPES